MLFETLRRLFTLGSSLPDKEARSNSFDNAASFSLKGDQRSAILAYRAHLDRHPLDVDAMNNLGCCLDDTGDREGAAVLFEKAFLIDDSNPAVVINYAKSFVDKQRISECMKYLPQVKCYEPDSPEVNAVYGGVALAKGDADTARRYALKAWLGNFDKLRLANCYLFYCSYTDMDEARLAAEHRFWAETLLPVSVPYEETNAAGVFPLPNKSKKIRIAYWSPDFRGHSVRYFALPLLENHDKDKFEVIVYHDTPHHDDQTDAVKACVDHFIPVSSLPDTQLVKLMLSHQLDILVELAGHSSNNRLNLLQERIATIQITGLGYPPTTGLSSIDGKIMDSHIATDHSARYYSETPLVLDTSFWCFDPKEKPEICEIAPAAKNGYITFACVGNIAKITSAMLDCWAKILSRVPNSRLLIRSISLNDTVAAQFIGERMKQHGIDLGRVDFFGPAGGAEFFASYNAVDIILDTYPFNGGTTSCFATYMGVPVLSMAGQSLVSRMGKSILTNLELADWIVTSYDDYVEKAILHAKDIAFLAQFRAQARKLYASTALGNGKLYAQEFEKKCVALFNQPEVAPNHFVDALPEEELIVRAYAVLRHGQFEAGARIVDHCLREYPNCGTAHVLSTYRLTEHGKFIEAIEYLEKRLAIFSPRDKYLALVNIARFNILANRPDHVKKAIDLTTTYVPATVVDTFQCKLLQAYQKTQEGIADLITPPVRNPSPNVNKITVLIVCDDENGYATLETRFRQTCTVTDGIKVQYRQCSEKNRWGVYQDILFNGDDDILIIAQKNIDICNAELFPNVIAALDQYDVIGVGGAKSWDRIEWRHSPIENKSLSCLIPSGEVNGFYEVQIAGLPQSTIVGNLAVLDGSFLVIQKASFSSRDPLAFFEPLLDEGGLLQEEYFTHCAFKAGLRLAAVQNIGIIIDWRITLNAEHLREARWHIAQHMSFDPFLELPEDRSIISVPVSTPEIGMKTLGHFLEDTDSHT